MKPRVPFKMLLRPAPPFRLTGENAALLLLDVQTFTTARDDGLALLARERGILREFDDYYLQVEAAIRNLEKLVAACRAHGLRVIHSVLSAQGAGGGLSRQVRLGGLPIPEDGPAATIREEVRPLPGELALARGTYSPFAQPQLLTALREGGIDTLVVAGMLANMVVTQTALEAADRDFGVVVAWDASASETLSWHDHLKTGLVGPLIRMRTTSQVIDMLEGTRT